MASIKDKCNEIIIAGVENPYADYRLEETYAPELAAKLLKAIEVLEWYGGKDSWSKPDSSENVYYYTLWNDGQEDAGQRARDALKELE